MNYSFSLFNSLFSLVFLLSTSACKAIEATEFVSDVVGVEEKMLYPDFWKTKIDDGEREILSAKEISAQKSDLFSNNQHMTDFLKFPNTLNKQEILKKITAISKIPTSQLYYHDGSKLSEQHWHNYLQQLNLSEIPAQKTIEFGLIVSRTNMRTFPTTDRVYKTDHNTNLDRFQETALFPTEMVALLHQSKDKQWYFAVSYNYSAWVKKDQVAIGTKDRITKYKLQSQFLVVTGDKVFTTFNPENEAVSEIQMEMGTELPLVPAEKIPTTLGGQNTYTSYVITIPTRNAQGKLSFEKAMIQRKADVSVGFLTLTRKNILQQSFKFLGERYGWGHSFNARDCTGFVGEIYKSFGILMPRNTGQQAKSSQGESISFDKNTANEVKLKQIKSLKVGDLIYIPGHVMMLLGFHQNEPYVIHDVSGLSYFKQDGEYYKSKLNGVSITPLIPLQLSRENSFLDKVYKIKKIK